MLFVHSAAPMTGSGLAAATVGQQLFLEAGTFEVPAGVTSICAVAIGTGGHSATINEEGVDTYYSGGGGALRYVNAIAVTPGETLTIEFGPSRLRLLRGPTALLGTVHGGYSGSGTVGTGFNGGSFAKWTNPALPRRGAGAGGYTSAGVSGGSVSSDKGGGGSSPYGGDAGAAAGAAATSNGAIYGGGGGGASGLGAPGCLRIIWGAGRAFPNTNTGDL